MGSIGGIAMGRVLGRTTSTRAVKIIISPTSAINKFTDTTNYITSNDPTPGNILLAKHINASNNSNNTMVYISNANTYSDFSSITY